MEGWWLGGSLRTTVLWYCSVGWHRIRESHVGVLQPTFLGSKTSFFSLSNFCSMLVSIFTFWSEILIVAPFEPFVQVFTRPLSSLSLYFLE